MSKLISGKDALIALANNQEVEYKTTDNAGSKWHQAKMLTVNTIMNFDDACILFRLKPRTITINGIEIPATFKPVEGDTFYYLSPEDECGYDYKCFVEGYPYFDGNKIQFGAWRTESEIKQVVAAQRIVFKPQ
mgnify:CR=1 FL=1